MDKRWILTAVFAAVGSTTLSGCSALGVGEEEFACTGMPGSVYCHSARDVYEKTNDGVVPSPVGKAEGSYNEECDDCVRAEDINPALRVDEDENSIYAVGVNSRAKDELIEVVDTKTGEKKTIRRKSLDINDDEVINNYVSPKLPSEPVPVRTPAQVMRIWVGPYVDTNGDLIAPGFVYTEIEPRRWIYPDAEQWGSNRLFAPLQAAKSYGYKRGESGSATEHSVNSLEQFKRAQTRKQ